MPCFNPHIEKGGAYSCGKCLSCRIQRRRIWTHRILLEASQHGDNCFCTLTYDDDTIAGNDSLSPRALQLFIKRLRFNAGIKIRYYACGEYGELNDRPHYHLALFGYPSCRYGVTRPVENCCSQCSLVRDTWGNGHVLLAQIEAKSAAYIAGYVTKGATVHPLRGRQKPFSRMSLKPAIGLAAMYDVADIILKENLEKTLIDVPTQLQHGTKKLPLGVYLRKQLRTMIGRSKNAPQMALQTQADEMQEMRLRAQESETALSKHYQKEILGRKRQIENRNRMYNKRDKI